MPSRNLVGIAISHYFLSHILNYPSVADAKMEMPVLIQSLKSSILSSTSFQFNNTFWGVVNTKSPQLPPSAATGAPPPPPETWIKLSSVFSFILQAMQICFPPGICTYPLTSNMRQNCCESRGSAAGTTALEQGTK